MFGRIKKRLEERKEQKKWKRLYGEKVAFCLWDGEFMDYGLPPHLQDCRNVLSLFEVTEKSFHGEVDMIFQEIAGELMQGCAVLQWQQQAGKEESDAQEFYCYREKPMLLQSIDDIRAYVEEVPCDLYIIIDMLRAALMVKTGKSEDLERVEEVMRQVCRKYEKEIHDDTGK